MNMQKKKNKHLKFIAAVALMAGPLVAQAQGYDYQSIDYPGASFSNAFGATQSGDVVGNGSIDPDRFPFIYDIKKGTFTNIAPVAGYDFTSVIGISDTGGVVGSVDDAAAGITSGLILARNGMATVFDHPSAAGFTQARGVNNLGLVTGYRAVDSATEFAAGFIYDPTTNTFTDIVPSFFTLPQGINARGDVVGSALFIEALATPDPCGSAPRATYGWLRTAVGSMNRQIFQDAYSDSPTRWAAYIQDRLDLGDVVLELGLRWDYFNVNGLPTRARGISDSGTVVGFVTDTATFEIKGFVTELDGTQCQTITIADEDLLQFPGAINTFPSDITNSGKITGSYQDESDNGGGFIATPK